jgi:hypothetical protein
LCMTSCPFLLFIYLFILPKWRKFTTKKSTDSQMMCEMGPFF